MLLRQIHGLALRSHRLDNGRVTTPPDPERSDLARFRPDVFSVIIYTVVIALVVAELGWVLVLAGGE